ncbi:MAG: c-type cytochrome, partial [Planctomycetes bacterium]|nr:c-type cytochrome [Planctomycetota bacterium]
MDIPPRVNPDAASLDRGKTLFSQYGCVACHGPDARGGLPLQEATGYPLVSRDLTAPWTFRGGSAPEQIWLCVTTGLAPAPMPAFESVMSPNERWDVVNYVLSLARVPPWEPGGKLNGPGQEADLLKRGRYLLHSQMCGICHTQTNPT